MGNKKSKLKESSANQTARSYFHGGNYVGIYTYIWLDENVYDTENIRKTIMTLEEVINRVKVLSNFKELEEYIQANGKDEKIILILNNNHDVELITYLQNVSQIRAIYLYCKHTHDNKQWLQLYSKIKSISSYPNELIQQVKQDQWIRERTDEDSLSINIYRRDSSNNWNYERQRGSRNTSFMHFLAFIDILLHMPMNKEKARKELMEVWTEQCLHNERERRLLQQFDRRYKPSKALYWCTTESFLYRTLNKGLREADFNIIFGLRFFLVDLYNCLIEEHKKYLRTCISLDSLFQIYHGQAISEDELYLIRENHGQLISFNNLLTTNTNQNVEMSFARNVSLTEGLTRILFEFNIDIRIKNVKPYVHVSNINDKSNEEEILIMLGSIFRIEDVHYDLDERIWIARLTMCSEDDYEVKGLMSQITTETAAGITVLGWLFYQQGDYKKGKEFFQQLLLEESLSDLDKANCSRGLGSIACQFKQYDEALIHYNNELSLSLKLNQQIETAIVYAEIGSVYARKREYKSALELETKALNILLPSNHAKLSSVYRVMADVFDEMNEYESAIDYYKKALAIDQQHLEENHAMFGSTYLLMGITYTHMENHSTALEYFMKAHEIYLNSLPSNHPQILKLEYNIQQAKRDLESKTEEQTNSSEDSSFCTHF